jgi:hypothetical protein
VTEKTAHRILRRKLWRALLLHEWEVDSPAEAAARLRERKRSPRPAAEEKENPWQHRKNMRQRTNRRQSWIRARQENQKKVSDLTGPRQTRCNQSFSLRTKQVYIRAHRGLRPPSLPYLIEIKTESCSWHTSTLDTMKIKLGSGKEPQPSRILYIGSSKWLNNYYAPRA